MPVDSGELLCGRHDLGLNSLLSKHSRRSIPAIPTEAIKQSGDLW